MYSSGRLQYDESAATGILQHLSKDELEELLSNDDKLISVVQDNPQVKGITEQKDTQQAVNRNLAEYTLSKEPVFSETKRVLGQLYTQAIELQKEHDKNRSKLEVLSSQQSVDTTLALLQTEAAKAEEKAEELADSFMEGSLECEDFVGQYIDIRKTAHLRKVKSEKMAELMRVMSNQRPGSLPPIQTATTPKSPTTQPTWGSSGAAPYPTGGYAGMPNPQTYMPYR